METMNKSYAILTAARYVCSACWGELEVTPASEGSHLARVHCKRCGLETKGYVTKAYAERRRQESMGDLINTSRMMKSLGMIEDPNKGKPASQLLAELGF